MSERVYLEVVQPKNRLIELDKQGSDVCHIKVDGHKVAQFFVIEGKVAFERFKCQASSIFHTNYEGCVSGRNRK
jgi:hypothetical protein